MWPDSPFASPRGSFQRPVLPPGAAPDVAPTKTVTVACAWLPFIRGALQQLLLEATWQPTTTPGLLQVQEWVFQLIDIFDECPTGDLPLACNYGFAESDGGFNNVTFTFTEPDSCMPVGTVYPSAVFVLGSGWQAFYDCTNSLLFIYKDITGFALSQIQVSGHSSEVRHLHVSVNTTTTVFDGDMPADNWTIIVPGSWSGVHLEIDYGKAHDSSVDAVITDVVLTGTGPGCP